VTVDYQFQTDNTVTVRERDSMAQVRVPIPEVPTVIRALVLGTTSWEEVEAKYPKVTKAADAEEEAAA
jgi:glycyl-tRNA synthetase